MANSNSGSLLERLRQQLTPEQQEQVQRLVKQFEPEPAKPKPQEDSTAAALRPEPSKPVSARTADIIPFPAKAVPVWPGGPVLQERTWTMCERARRPPKRTDLDPLFWPGADDDIA